MLPVPAPGFDQPLALLRACHERILRQCATLAKLALHVRAEGPGPEAHRAAAEVYRYFSTAGQHHHEDEEQDLFPRLRAHADLAGLLTVLAGEHRRMEVLWQQLAPMLREPDGMPNIAVFEKLAAEFNALYAAHIERENRELLPRAEQLLSEDVLRELAARMAARRGVTL